MPRQNPSHLETWPHVYGGPTLEPRAGGVGIRTNTKGRVVGDGPDGMVEFLPSWGEGFLTVYLPKDEVHDRGPEELERLL